MRLLKNQFVEVLWLDTEEDPAWQSDDSIAKPPDTYCSTKGHYLTKDEKFLYFTHTLAGKQEQPGNRIAIPRGCIEDIHPCLSGRESLWRKTKCKPRRKSPEST